MDDDLNVEDLTSSRIFSSSETDLCGGDVRSTNPSVNKV